MKKKMMMAMMMLAKERERKREKAFFFSFSAFPERPRFCKKKKEVEKVKKKKNKTLFYLYKIKNLIFSFYILPANGKRCPNSWCCMIGSFPHTSTLYILSKPSLTLLQVGTVAAMSQSIGDVSLRGPPFFTVRTKRTASR